MNPEKSSYTAPEEDWNNLAGTAEKTEKIEKLKRENLFRALGRRAVELFRPSARKKAESQPADEWYDFPDDSTTSETIEPLAVSKEVLEGNEPDLPTTSEFAGDSKPFFTEQTEPLLSEADQRDFLKATDQLADRKHQRFESQRVQELVEREINKKLTTIEKLEDEVLAENPEVAKREIEYSPKDQEATGSTNPATHVTVYDLKGIPFAFVSHAVDYRRANVKVNGGVGDIGTQTFQDIVDNPAIWTETREQAEKAAGYGTRAANARGDTISCSYTNSETNPNTRVGSNGYDKNLVYGFEALRPDSLIYAVARDGGTNNNAGRAETSLRKSDLNTIKTLEGNPTVGYNELLLRRYDEQGEPLKPNYIIAADGQITDEMLRHASFFNIPIINVENKAYEAKLNKKATEALNSISEQSSYAEITAAIDAIRHSPSYGHYFYPHDSYGRKRDADGISGSAWHYPAGELREKFVALEELEYQKRLDLIESELTDLAESYEAANAAGEYRDIKPKHTDAFFIYAHDVENGLFCGVGADSPESIRQVPGNSNSITVEIIPKNGEQRISLDLYDAEHPYKPEEALARGNITQEDIDQADSGPYTRLKPLFDRYSSAYRTNIHLPKAAA